MVMTMVREKLFLESKEGKGLSGIGSNASLKVKRFHSEVKNHLLSNSPLVFALLSCHHVSSFSFVLQCCKHPASGPATFEVLQVSVPFN